MALQENFNTFSYEAGDVVGQYRLVGQGSTARTVEHCGAGELPVGATLNKATAAGQALTVAAGGIIKLEAGEAIDPGELVAAGANGVAMVAAAGDFTIGPAISAAGDVGEIFECHAIGAWVVPTP